MYECFPAFAGNVHDMDYSIFILEQRNIFNVEHVYDAFVQYPHFSIEEAIRSDNVVIQALAMIDKRLGKRRLTHLKFDPDTHPLVTTFYRIRYEAEGLSLSHSLLN
ncbi:SF0329 family protein [Pseudobacillus wudalianchiensis]|uniref:SF0329 family protein n=1 Tax=Pseudobacillus wudalianchiensis TaxID=1743143 RepID=UPI001FE144CB|nr:hypothetical protein [Bacillus wudalianchiensis]